MDLRLAAAHDSHPRLALQIVLLRRGEKRGAVHKKHIPVERVVLADDLRHIPLRRTHRDLRESQRRQEAPYPAEDKGGGDGDPTQFFFYPIHL